MFEPPGKRKPVPSKPTKSGTVNRLLRLSPGVPGWTAAAGRAGRERRERERRRRAGHLANAQGKLKALIQDVHYVCIQT